MKAVQKLIESKLLINNIRNITHERKDVILRWIDVVIQLLEDADNEKRIKYKKQEVVKCSELKLLKPKK